MSILKLSTARNRVFSFAGVSITVLTVTISKNGAAFAAAAGALTNISGVFYKLALTNVDTNTLGDLAYQFSDSILGVISPDGGDVDEVCPDLPGVLADGVAHGGTLGSSTATLALAGFNVTAGDATAVRVQNNSPSGFSAARFSANGNGATLSLDSSSADSETLQIFGGNTKAGVGIYGPTLGTGAPAVLVDNLPADTGGSGGKGISIVCDGDDGLSVVATGGGQGIQTKGANGISAISTGGGGSGIFAHGDTTAPGIDALGGATSGVGIRAKSGTGSNAAGMLIQGDGGGDGLDILGGSTSGLGLFAQGFGTHGGIVAQGGTTGAALQLIGGATSGAGIKVTTVNGNGIDLTGAAGAGKSGFAGTLDSTAVNSITQTALTESYAANGAAFTLTQALYEICQGITQFSIAGVTITAQKRDHATTAMTFTMDSATAPTSRTRAT